MGKLLLLLLPFFSFAQEKNINIVSRCFPKVDKVQQFEKALRLHAQKFHRNDLKWRIYSIETGPDAGGYHIIEGPISWNDADIKDVHGNPHLDDWYKTVQPLLSERISKNYFIFLKDFSSIEQTDYSDKISINHIYPKPGYSVEMQDMFRKLKKAWEAGGSTVAVYESTSSGTPQFLLVSRYKQGLKERNAGFRTSMRVLYTKVNGDQSWDEFMQTQRVAIDNSWSELLFYRAELSSK